MAPTHRDEISRLELLHAAHPDGLVFPHLADAYRRAGRYSKAEGVLSAGLRRHSDYTSAHVVLGRLRLDQGKQDEAERAFVRVLELDPQNHVALEHLARLSEEQGRLEDALRRFRKLAQLKPGAEVEERLRHLESRVAELRRGRVAAPNGEGPSSDGPARRTTQGAPGPSSTPGNGAGRASHADSAADSHAADRPGRRLEPGEVVTETMAELYSVQGLHQRAASVYRQLVERRPGDVRLRQKLREAEAELRPTGVPEDLHHPATPAPPSPNAAEGAPPRTNAATAAEPRPAAGAAPQPPAREEEGSPRSGADPRSGTGRAIRDQLRTLLAWRPGGPSSPVAAPEPAEQPPPARAPRERTENRRTDPRPPSPAVPPARAPAGVAPAAAAAVPEAMDPTSRSLIAITDLLVGLLEYRDPFFRGSSSLTRLLAENVAEAMGLPASQRVDLALAAVLRDLGRLAMGGRLVKASGSQTPEGRRRIERHVDLALHLLDGIGLPATVRRAVRHHHERWDGAGYPDGLRGEQIPPLARILAVVDSFAAMVSPRSYRLPRKVPDAAREIRESAGSQYDPSVVEALMRVLERRDQPHLGFVQRPHVLLVDPDQPGAVVTAAKLCSAGYLAEVSPDPDAARERLRRVPVSALVISAEVGPERTAELVRVLRVDPSFAALPIVVMEAETVSLRIRLLESGADVCFPPGTSHGELQGTLGSLVRRNVGRRVQDEGKKSPGEAPWLALQGDLEDFPLTWLLQVMKYDSRTAAIGIRADDAEGAIYLRKGDAVHARIRGGDDGESALRQMLQWDQGRFTVQPDARATEQTIETSIMHLLLTQAVDQDHAAAGIFGAVSDEG